MVRCLWNKKKKDNEIKTGSTIMAQLVGFLWHDQNTSWFDKSSPVCIMENKWMII